MVVRANEYVRIKAFLLHGIRTESVLLTTLLMVRRKVSGVVLRLQLICNTFAELRLISFGPDRDWANFGAPFNLILRFGNTLNGTEQNNH